MDDTRRIKVLVAHRQPLVRAGLAATLGRCTGIDVVLRPPSAMASVDAQVIVLDCADGLQLAAERRLQTRPSSGPAILIVAAQTGEWEIRRAVSLGVHGLHLVDAPLERLLAGVRTLAAGGRSFDESVSTRLADCLTLPLLTQRESDVLSLLAAGACNKEIARRLAIALGTVKAHVRTLFDKLDVESRVQAIVVARARGIVAHAC